MARIKVCLFKRHSHRTPMSYAVYQDLFAPYIEFVEDPASADWLVTGTFTDYRRHADDVLALLNGNPSLQCFVLSEEPYWDVCWDANFVERSGEIVRPEGSFTYHRFNHSNSALYEFAHLPYYLTTDNDFFARYAALFKRNAALSAEDWLAHWQQCRYREAYLVEHRLEDKFAVDRPDLSLWSYSVLRTLLAQRVFSEDNSGTGLVAGYGWRDEARRQDLDDWHLDKLLTLDGAAVAVSALENTHQQWYLSEKLFDAYAVGSVPIYAADAQHGVFKLLTSPALLNVFGLSAAEAGALLDSFTPDLTFARAYTATQQQLAALFAQPWLLHEERARVVREVLRSCSPAFHAGTWRAAP